MYCCIGKLFGTKQSTIDSYSINDMKLESATYENTIPFIPPVHRAKVIKVYDGDTITVASYLPIDGEPNTIYRFPVRLSGIDTAEIKSKSVEEKELAKKSRDLLKGLVFEKIVDLENITIEKYGRLLADVYVSDNTSNSRIHVNKWMLDNGFAKKYDGGTKDIFIFDNKKSK